jgi:hypothetical protein
MPSGLLGTVVLVELAAAVGVPILYSPVLWRREEAAAQPSGYSSTSE